MVPVAELTARQREILRRVVEEYVSTGEPVGSKTLVERTAMSVSPSTVRNELAGLADAVDEAALARLTALGLTDVVPAPVGPGRIALTPRGRLLGGGVTAELLV